MTKIAEVHQTFGGTNFNSSYFYTSSVHPSAEGGVVRGKLLAQASISAILAL